MANRVVGRKVGDEGSEQRKVLSERATRSLGEGKGKGRGGKEHIGKRRLQESHDLPSKLQVRELIGRRSFCYQYVTHSTQHRRRSGIAVRIHLDGGTGKRDGGIVKLPTKNGAGGIAGIPHVTKFEMTSHDSLTDSKNSLTTAVSVFRASSER